MSGGSKQSFRNLLGEVSEVVRALDDCEMSAGHMEMFLWDRWNAWRGVAVCSGLRRGKASGEA